MLNKIILIGRLTKDPEMRSTTSNISVTTFMLAVDRSFTNQQGEREADFIPIVTWRKLAETCARYLTKGRLVAVSGRLQVRSYEDNNGQRRYISEVVADEVQFLERNPSASQGESSPQYTPYQQNEKPASSDFIDPVEDDDELPF
ncbi:MAG TPA: single-stranded DNA-binding protein [Clostridiales bacterium]|nr:single-stranded DNA-binding protein [Clostridia bacterium]HCS73974.1 single-stranded DNA-binding protein [Clostridiales bacterium]